MEIRNGIHTQSRTFTYDELQEFKKGQFELFKQTETYHQLKQDEIKAIAAKNEVRKKSGEKLGPFSLRTFTEKEFETTIELQLLHIIDRFYE